MIQKWMRYKRMNKQNIFIISSIFFAMFLLIAGYLGGNVFLSGLSLIISVLIYYQIKGENHT
ncbi:hypothetical protein EFM1CSP_05225 [Enterococcus faecium]|nr:hypothetical protein EFM1CSP_05225 [Enterococcus faecium]